MICCGIIVIHNSQISHRRNPCEDATDDELDLVRLFSIHFVKF